LNKTITDYEEKRKQRCLRAQTNNSNRVVAETEIRKERHQSGKRSWKNLKQSNWFSLNLGFLD